MIDKTTQFDYLVESLDPTTIHLLPGKVIIDQDPPESQIGSLFLPQRDHTEQHPANTGTVAAIGHGEFFYDEESNGKRKRKLHPGLAPDELRVGDRVVFRLLALDLNRKRIFTDVRRIDGVLEP